MKKMSNPKRTRKEIREVIKKLSEKQKKIARAAHPYNEITGADFKALKAKNA